MLKYICKKTWNLDRNFFTTNNYKLKEKSTNNFYYRVFFFIFVIFSCFYGILGFYIVKPAEQAVVTRFGKYHRTHYQGPHWYPYYIEEVIVVNTERLERGSHVSSMLTKDENIVNVGIEVQHRVIDPELYLFKLAEPEKVLKEAVDSALRQVVGSSTLDFVVTIGKAQVAHAIQEQLQSLLDSYESGIYVATVALRDVSVPISVKAAFDDVIKAQEEKEELKHQAEAFANKIVPEARGLAVKIEQEAKAYRYEVVYAAQGDVLEFNLILPRYKSSPDVIRTRIYIDVLENILMKTTKIFLDLGGENSLVYLPIDRLFNTSK